MNSITKIIKEHFACVDSTNNRAALQAEKLKEGELLLITADQQTAGRGRFGHYWLSPNKMNFYGTFCFLFDNKRMDAGNLPQILAISAMDALEKKNVSVQLKWPNDLLVNGQKIGGILTEAKATQRPGWIYVIAGVGLNINMPIELIKTIDRPATSLMIEIGKSSEIEIIGENLQQIFIQDLNLFITSGISPFLNKYKEKMFHQLGEKICFHTAGKILEGEFQGINEAGLLKLQLPDGTRSEFSYGEIF